MDYPLRPIVTGWVNKIKAAMQYKKEKFQQDADEAMAFYNGPYAFMYGAEYAAKMGALFHQGEAQLPKPSFCMTVNKVAEMVQLYGPVLYHRNPTRKVNPRKQPMIPPTIFGNVADPNVQMMYMQMMTPQEQAQGLDDARAVLMEHYLNYTPTALDLKTESRFAIDEALIKGMGVLWTELYQPIGANFRMVGSFYDTVDNLVLDPDMESIADAKWCARKRVKPLWQVEQEFGLPQGYLQGKGNMESIAQQAYVQSAPNGEHFRKMGLTNDLLVYWEVYSKMGMGGRLSGIAPGVREETDRYGDFCKLVICDTCEYPLNLPPMVTETPGNDAIIMQRLQWETPFWIDGGWPFSHLVFHTIPNQIWPMSHLKPGLGELKFINWAYSFLAGKIKNTCRDFVAVAKAAGEEIKNTILHGADMELLEIEKSFGTIKEVIEFLQHPQMNGDIWNVIEAIERNFEKRVGLTELMYGQSAVQLRSAQEANVKADQLRVRPDDMSNKVEDWASDAARKEAIAVRYHLSQQDVAPVMGPVGTYWWQQLITPTDMTQLIHQMEYRIEAGSARKPNKDRDVSNMQQAMTNLFAPLMQYAMATGNVGPVNSLMAAWAKSLDFDAKQFMLTPPPPPPMPGEETGKPQPKPQQQAA